mgnify:CR=1 FL=1
MPYIDCHNFMKETREIVKNPLSDTAEIEQAHDSQVAAGAQYASYRYAQSENSQLLDYWRAIRKRLWLVIGIAVLATILSAIYMAKKPSIYQATARVQVDNEQLNPDLVTSDRQRPMSSADPSYFNTQLQLLWSDSLLRRVIKEKNLDSNPEFVLAKGENSTSTLRSILKSVGLATDDQNSSASDGEYTSDSSLVTSEEIAEAKHLAPYVDVIHKSLEIDPVRESRATMKDTRLISISFRHTSPELAAHVVNSIAETFTTVNQERRSGTNRKTNDFLQDRIATLQSDIQADEQKLVALTENAGILKTGEGEQTIVIDRLSGLNKALLVAENERKTAEANFLSVSNSPDKIKAIAEAEITQFTQNQENNIRALQTDTIKKINDLRNLRIEKQQLFTEGAPELKQIDAQIKSYEDSVDKAIERYHTQLEAFRKRATTVTLENLRTKYLAAKANEDKIRVDFNKQFGEAQGQNQSAVSIKLLQQNIETNKGFLENLRKQVSGNDVAAQGTDNNISVVEIAIPPDTPAAPRRLMTVLAVLFLSTLFGMGLALVLEYLDDTIRTTDEIENYLQLPALAASLEQIATNGRDGFYTGKVAEDLVATLRDLGGLHTPADFAAQRASAVTPVSVRYRDVELFELPPSNQGLVALLLLRMHERMGPVAGGPDSPERYHVLLEAARLAYAVRDRYVADPEVAQTPVEAILSDRYVDNLVARIDRKQRRTDLGPVPAPVGSDTTYLTVVDETGMAVSFINSLFSDFGSGIVGRRSGIALTPKDSSWPVRFNLMSRKCSSAIQCGCGRS